jgi:hypothetical protein
MTMTIAFEKAYAHSSSLFTFYPLSNPYRYNYYTWEDTRVIQKIRKT